VTSPDPIRHQPHISPCATSNRRLVDGAGHAFLVKKVGAEVATLSAPPLIWTSPTSPESYP